MVADLLGNGKLRTGIEKVYQAIAHCLCAGKFEIFILVDWSSLVSHQFHSLKASLVVQGRSETVHLTVSPHKSQLNF